MKLLAISDLHLANRSNQEALRDLPPFPEDWLLLGGDTGETEEHLEMALDHLVPRFQKVIWVPGNHDLWTLDNDPSHLCGEAKYRRLVKICRSHGAVTPEDPYLRWPASEGCPEHVIAPLFLLYDYTFRPPEIPAEKAVAWARKTGVLCSDEFLIHPAPHASREEWCAARLRWTRKRLDEATASGLPTILLNHFPLRYDLVYLPRIPRFSIWCGTRATEDWHLRYRATAVVYGHLHIKNTQFRDGVRFEEVSLGYPRDWNRERGIETYLRQILPTPDTWLSRTRPDSHRSDHPIDRPEASCRSS